MLKLGIIGTGSISHQFIEAAQLSQHYQLTAVYSRNWKQQKLFLHVIKILPAMIC